MATVISVLQVKGGAGRSTIATNLAGEFSKTYETTLIDCDLPQGTSQSWYAVRQQEHGSKLGSLVLDGAETHKELLLKVKKHQGQQVIILDGAPRLMELSRLAMLISDLVLIPLGSSSAELWATSDVLDLYREASQVKPVKAYLVWTRQRKDTKSSAQLQATVKAEVPIPALKTKLGFRASYMECLGAGLTVCESSDRYAKQELKALTAEVKKIVKKL